MSAGVSPERLVWFRGRDNWCLSDRRRALVLRPGEEAAWAFDVPDDPGPGTAEAVLTACLELHGCHAYIRRHLNSVLEILVNGAPVFSGIHHWRSHEETVAFWNPFDFPFDAALLRRGANTIAVRNRTTREALGEFLDRELIEQLGEAEGLRRLSTIMLAAVEVNWLAGPPVLPCVSGVPPSAIAGVPFVVEVATAGPGASVSCREAEHAEVAPLGAEHEFGAWRHLFAVTAASPGRPCRARFDAGGPILEAGVDRVYAPAGRDELVIGPGAESTYWHNVLRAAQDFYELDTGNCLRISVDGFLANLHHVPPAEWRPLIRYLVRRRRHYALQRLRVPPYSRVGQGDLAALADIGGRELFAGVAVPEPVLFLHRAEPAGTLQERLQAYLAYFAKRMEETRLPGHKIVTFDSAGPLCGHYYRLGLDVHVAEIGPACNCLEEACCRGGAAAAGKPWGVAVAMHWYCGQGAQYACDDSRLRFARLVMQSSYLAGARHIVWEGGVFDNLPVYNYVLSEESWRDFGRRYDDEPLPAIRRCFRETLDAHRAQQLPQPRVRYGIVRGANDLFSGTFNDAVSAHGDLALARGWTLLKVFLPHVSWGRWGTDHGRPVRRWYSHTPHGQVDVVPAEASADVLARYRLLAMVSWNTMDAGLYARLCEYVAGGGTLFVSLPHFTQGTKQELEWTCWNGGDIRTLAGVRVNGLGGRIERVRFEGPGPGAAAGEFVLTPKNPLFVDDFDEKYPVFSHDVTHFAGEIEVDGAEVLARSQRGDPVVLRKGHGRGSVVLLNTYFHPGRGRMLDLAEAILRGLAEEQAGPVRVADPSGRIAWLEYEGDGFSRVVLLNTDWTAAGHVCQATVRIGSDALALDVPEGAPVQVATDGLCHVVIADLRTQVARWRRGDGWDIELIGPGPWRVHAPPGAEVRVNGARASTR